MECGAKHMRGDVGDQQRLAVGGGARDQLVAEGAGGAAAVLHDHIVAEALLQMRGDQPRHQVGGAGGGVGHYEFRRVRGGGRCGEQSENGTENGEGAHHAFCFTHLITKLLGSQSGLGYLGSISSSVSRTIAAMAALRAHLWSAGMMCHGAHVVEHLSSASS